MDLNYLRKNNLIIFEAISGSKAYGLNTPESDIDIKGVFVLPKNKYFSLNYITQINNATNDIVFYELNRFLELLSVNNPNILELLNTPKNSIIYKHPLLDNIDSTKILSKLCEKTFGNFAISQIKKAKGLKKKIFNPQDRERKDVLEFCYVNYHQGSIPLTKFLEIKKIKQQNCGLVNIPYMQNVYGLFHGKGLGYKGIVQSENANDVSLSSIPKGEKQIALLYFNKDGYSKYCKDYKEYWAWVKNRNEARYKNTLSHGKNYDAKNMMHTFRLLDMAIEIATEHQVNVKRPNRDFLLNIKSGNFEYDYLMELANEKQQQMKNAFKNSVLIEKPDYEYINKLAFEIRNQLYNTVIQFQ